MQIYVIVILFIFGLLFGSFSSVIIERLHGKQKGIIGGRSECPHCHHILAATDLFPLFSYLFLWGKCRYCKTKISEIYPLLELAMGIFFALGGVFFINAPLLFSGSLPELVKLVFILFISFVVVIFTFYDIRFMEIPDEIMIPSIFLLIILLSISTWIFPLPIFAHFWGFETLWLNNTFMNGGLAALIIYTFFYLQMLIPGVIYAFEQKKYRIIWQILAEYFTFFIWMGQFLITRKYEENSEEEEIPTWIGGGDLRIALFMGLVAGVKIALLGLFLSYIIGSIIGVGVYIKTRERGKHIPFWPFLGTGLLFALLFHTQIFQFINSFIAY